MDERCEFYSGGADPMRIGHDAKIIIDNKDKLNESVINRHIISGYIHCVREKGTPCDLAVSIGVPFSGHSLYTAKSCKMSGISTVPTIIGGEPHYFVEVWIRPCYTY